MRYWRTNIPKYLRYRWDGERMWYRNGDFLGRFTPWYPCRLETPDNLNEGFEPHDGLYLYETDKRGNRL